MCFLSLEPQNSTFFLVKPKFLLKLLKKFFHRWSALFCFFITNFTKKFVHGLLLEIDLLIEILI